MWFCAAMRDTNYEAVLASAFVSRTHFKAFSGFMWIFMHHTETSNGNGGGSFVSQPPNIKVITQKLNINYELLVLFLRLITNFFLQFKLTHFYSPIFRHLGFWHYLFFSSTSSCSCSSLASAPDSARLLWISAWISRLTLSCLAISQIRYFVNQ